jgi:hypothetical protein
MKVATARVQGVTHDNLTNSKKGSPFVSHRGMAIDEDAPVPLQKPDVRLVALINDVPENRVLRIEFSEPLAALPKEAFAVLVQSLPAEKPDGSDHWVGCRPDAPDAEWFVHRALVAQDVTLARQLDATEKESNGVRPLAALISAASSGSSRVAR